MNLIQYSIRALRKSDIVLVKEIEVGTGISAWQISDYEDAVESDRYLTFVAIRGSLLLGFVVVMVIQGGDAENNTFEILNIAVLPKVQSSGIGSALVKYLVESMARANVREMWLDVREGNAAARRFYLKNGFHEVGRRSKYYSNPCEDAILMTYRTVEK